MYFIKNLSGGGNSFEYLMCKSTYLEQVMCWQPSDKQQKMLYSVQYTPYCTVHRQRVVANRWLFAKVL
jgi:hypothetical protein